MTESARFDCFLHACVPILTVFEAMPGNWHGERKAVLAGLREGRFGTECGIVSWSRTEYYEGRK